MVDRPVCGNCVNWFEGAFWTDIGNIQTANNVTFSVVVGVDYQNRYRATQLSGPGTNWGSVRE